jgi:hypothetical protein
MTHAAHVGRTHFRCVAREHTELIVVMSINSLYVLLLLVHHLRFIALEGLG